jgi:hypothetical protein
MRFFKILSGLFSFKNLTLILVLAFITSCKKPAGPGGSSSIKGKLWVEDWNAGFTVKNGEYAGADEDVYIVYGDETGYGDRTRADYKGEFEFKYLRKGKYKVYVYSKDNTLQSVSGDISIVQETEIISNRQTITLDQFTIYK